MMQKYTVHQNIQTEDCHMLSTNEIQWWFIFASKQIVPRSSTFPIHFRIIDEVQEYTCPTVPTQESPRLGVFK